MKPRFSQKEVWPSGKELDTTSEKSVWLIQGLEPPVLCLGIGERPEALDVTHIFRSWDDVDDFLEKIMVQAAVTFGSRPAAG